MKAFGRMSLLFWAVGIGGVASLYAPNSLLSGQMVDATNAAVTNAHVSQPSSSTWSFHAVKEQPKEKI